MSELSRRYAIIEAPSILGLKPTGVDRLPEQLLNYGLIERARCGSKIEADRYHRVIASAARFCFDLRLRGRHPSVRRST